jgi:hypothetical protein
VGFTSCTETEIQTHKTNNTSPIEITWEDLKFDSISEVWSEELETVYMSPYFNTKTIELDSRKVTISGKLHRVNNSLKTYFLYPETSKFSFGICGNAWPKDDCIIQINFLNKLKHEINDKMTVVGELKLNKDDMTSLFYILEDAKIITNK